MSITGCIGLLLLAATSVSGYTSAADNASAKRPCVGEVRALAIVLSEEDVIALHRGGWLEVRGQLLSTKAFPELFRRSAGPGPPAKCRRIGLRFLRFAIGRSVRCPQITHFVSWVRPIRSPAESSINRGSVERHCPIGCSWDVTSTLATSYESHARRS